MSNSANPGFCWHVQLLAEHSFLVSSPHHMNIWVWLEDYVLRGKPEAWTSNIWSIRFCCSAMLPSGKQTWLLKMAIYSELSHWKKWFSIVMLVYQRVQDIDWMSNLKMEKGDRVKIPGEKPSNRWVQPSLEQILARSLFIGRLSKHNTQHRSTKTSLPTEKLT